MLDGIGVDHGDVVFRKQRTVLCWSEMRIINLEGELVRFDK